MMGITMSDTTETVETEDVVVAPGPETVRTVTPYEKKLRSEAQKYRLRAQEIEATSAKQLAELRAEMEAKVSMVSAAATEKLVRAELKAAAIKAGIVDLDGLRLADVSGVKLTDSGDVEGAEALIEKLKETKPYLFAAVSSTTTAKPPSQDPPKAKSAKDMTPDEFKSALAQYGVRR